MEENCIDYEDDSIKIQTLLFADDILILANNVQDAGRNLDHLTNINRCGLGINKEKSKILILYMKNRPKTIR